MAKTLRELKEFDTIEVLGDIRDMKAPKKSCYQSLLPEYVIKMKASHPAFSSFGECVIYAYFSEETGVMEMYLYYRKDYAFNHFVTADFNKFNGSNMSDMFVEFGTNVSQKMAELSTLLVIDTMNYICERMMDVETVVKTDRQPRAAATSSKTTSASNKQPRRTVRVLNADKVIYTLSTSSNRSIDRVRSYRKYSGSWNVVGHMRHYKSGKTVWVNPYIKGEGAKQVKQYIVK